MPEAVFTPRTEAAGPPLAKRIRRRPTRRRSRFAPGWPMVAAMLAAVAVFAIWSY